MKIAPVLFSVLCLALGSLGLPELVGQEKKPASWEEFVEFHQSVGSFGTYTHESVTEAMWEGMDAGQKFIGRSTSKLSPDGKAILNSHRMETEKGDVISVGTGMCYWDARTGTVKSSYSGFDQGKLFTGSSELQGIDPGTRTVRWLYTENSQGKTTRYLQKFVHVTPTRLKQIVSKESGGKVWEEELTEEECCQGAGPRLRILPRLLGR